MNLKHLYITYSYILNLYSQEQIFEFLFGQPINMNKFYTNPLRNDKGAGCKFVYMNKSLIFKDFSKGINYSWVVYGTQLLQLNEKDLYIYIYNNLKSVKIINEFTQNNKLKIDIKIKDFLNSELFSFYDYKCSKELLKKANIYSVDKVYYNNECVLENCKNIYAFINIDEKGEKNYQLYFPKKEKINRYKNTSNLLIPQLENLDINQDYVIITKSNMDAFILKHILGFNAIAILNENVMLSDSFMRNLNLNFSKIILLFDNDNVGRKAVIKYIKNYSYIKFKVLFVPFKHGKDTKDVVMNNKVEDVKYIINKKLK